MKSILRGLYHGDIIPSEHSSPQSEEYREILRKIESEERYFTSKLPPVDRERFQKLSFLHLELSDAEEENLFSYAFSLGMLLTLDVTRHSRFRPAGRRVAAARPRRQARGK